MCRSVCVREKVDQLFGRRTRILYSVLHFRMVRDEPTRNTCKIDHVACSSTHDCFSVSAFHACDVRDTKYLTRALSVGLTLLLFFKDSLCTHIATPNAANEEASCLGLTLVVVNILSSVLMVISPLCLFAVNEHVAVMFRVCGFFPGCALCLDSQCLTALLGWALQKNEPKRSGTRTSLKRTNPPFSKARCSYHRSGHRPLMPTTLRLGDQIEGKLQRFGVNGAQDLRHLQVRLIG